MNAYISYSIIVGLLIISYYKDKKKTKKALMKAWKSFNNILPQLLGVMMLVGLLLVFFDAESISKLIGEESGFIGVFTSAVVGAITLIPGFVAFPTASLLLEQGAGYMQVGAFISALMMVGILTIPIEIEYFGKRTTYIRNIVSFLFCFVVAFIIGKVVGGI